MFLNRRINKGYSRTVGCSSAVNKEQLLMQVTIWMDLKGTMLRKQSQSQYIPHYRILFIKHPPNDEMRDGNTDGGFQGWYRAGRGVAGRSSMSVLCGVGYCTQVTK